MLYLICILYLFGAVTTTHLSPHNKSGEQVKSPRFINTGVLRTALESIDALDEAVWGVRAAAPDSRLMNTGVLVQ